MKIFHIFIIITLLYISSSKDIEIEKKLDGIPISSDSNSEKIHFAFDGDLSTILILKIRATFIFLRLKS